MEGNLEAVIDISCDPIMLDNLEYIISDYLFNSIMNESTSHYYVSAIVSMIKSLDENVILKDIDRLVSLISFSNLPTAFKVSELFQKSSFLFFFALIDYLLSIRENHNRIDAIDICKQIIKQSNFSEDKMVGKLSSIPIEVISTIHKRHLMGTMYSMP